MSRRAKFIGEVAASSAAAAIIACLCAESVSVGGIVRWVIVLIPVCALSVVVARRAAQKFSPSTRGDFVVQVCGIIAAIVGVYAESVVVHWVRADLVPDPFAASNLVPGVIAGVVSWWAVRSDGIRAVV